MPFPDTLPPDFLAKAAALNIQPQDMDEQFIRGSGSGGQKINKTASCVYLKHVPTGIDVRCQKHREQSKNRISAYKLLILKIEEKMKGKQSDLQQKVFKLRKQKNRRSAKAKRKMLDAKAHRAGIKENRGKIVS